MKQNPIYHFYDVVQLNAAGQAGDPGDKHYKCYLGNRKVLTITCTMKGGLNGKSYRVSASIFLANTV
jgi:hypothetical protein